MNAMSEVDCLAAAIAVMCQAADTLHELAMQRAQSVLDLGISVNDFEHFRRLRVIALRKKRQTEGKE